MSRPKELKCQHGKIMDLLDEYCSNEWREVLDMNKTVAQYPKGVRVFSEGQIANVIQIIETGKLKVVADFSGKERLVRLACDGSVIGHRGFGGDNTYSVSAITLTPVKIITIPRKVFDNILKANPLFCYHFLMFFAEELRITENQMKNLSSMPVLNRVAKAIRINMQEFGYDPDEPTKLSFTLSRKDYANYAVTTYESVIRSITKLSKDGIIKTIGKSIFILNKEALVKLSK